MALSYKYNSWYPKQTGQQYLFLGLQLGYCSGSFSQTVRKACNALINTAGGIIVFGVEKETGIIKGVSEELNREQQDLYRLAVDRELRNFTPSVQPDSYRINIVGIDELGEKTSRARHVLEIKVSVGRDMFEDSRQEVYVVKHNKVHGPLFPQELKDLVLIKYKEEIILRATALNKDETLNSSISVLDDKN